MGCIFPDDHEYRLDHLRKEIVSPYHFDTEHPYSANSEKLIEKIIAWAEEEGIRLFTRGYIRGSRWLTDTTEKHFNTLHWQVPDEDTAFYVLLTWNGRE